MAEQIENNTGYYIPKRYILIFLGFFGMFNVYAMRVNLSVAMVAMLNNTGSAIITNVTHEAKECGAQHQEEEKIEVSFKGEQYNWSPKTQGMVLGAFFCGCIITQIPGGYLSEKFGAKWMYGGAVLLTSILTLLTPLSARMGTSVFVAVRILEGFGQGVTFPAMNFLVSQWAPLLERSRVATTIFIGAQVGNVVTMPLCGWMCSSEMFGGWPSAFYLLGTIGCVWFVFWAILVHESPSVHPTISHDELSYIQLHNDTIKQEKPPLPWKSVFTSLPMWATLIAHIGNDFGYIVYFTELPNYMSSIFHFKITQNGALSALPFMMQSITAFFASFAADKLRSSGKLTITMIRKVMNSIGLLGPAICLLSVTVSGCRSELVVCLLTLGMALNGFVYSGFRVTHIDMSPDFPGTLFGITNTCANFNGVIVPAIVGTLTSNGSTILLWNKVFYLTSGVYVVCAIFYFLFASAERQPWGRASKRSEENELSTADATSYSS